MGERYALVTGGAGGIGAAVCRLLARRGIRPLVCSRRPDEGDRVAAETGGRALAMDLADASAVAGAWSQMADIVADVECVILAASPPPVLKRMAQVSTEELESYLRVNVLGHHLIVRHLMSQSFQPQRRGSVVAVSSEAAGKALFGAYAVSKSALEGYLASLAADYPWLRVRVVSPGLVETPMLAAFDPRVVERMRETQPVLSAESAAEIILREAYPDER